MRHYDGGPGMDIGGSLACVAGGEAVEAPSPLAGGRSLMSRTPVAGAIGPGVKFVAGGTVPATLPAMAGGSFGRGSKVRIIGCRDASVAIAVSVAGLGAICAETGPLETGTAITSPGLLAGALASVACAGLGTVALPLAGV